MVRDLPALCLSFVNKINKLSSNTFVVFFSIHMTVISRNICSSAFACRPTCFQRGVELYILPLCRKNVADVSKL